MGRRCSSFWTASPECETGFDDFKPDTESAPRDEEVPTKKMKGKQKKYRSTVLGEKVTTLQKEEALTHIKSFPAYESHYPRNRTQNTYLGSGLSVNKMHELYCEKCLQQRQYHIQFIMMCLKQQGEDLQKLEEQREHHNLMYKSAYRVKDEEPGRKVVVFDMQQSLADRGSDQVASVLYKHIQANIPGNVQKRTIFSDTCAGQNRNMAVAIKFMVAIQQYSSLKVVNQTFLVLVHSHLECDSDHTSIERAKNKMDVEIRIPHDWYLFVKTMRGKKPFNVYEMKDNDFLSFSSLLQTYHGFYQSLTTSERQTCIGPDRHNEYDDEDWKFLALGNREN
ncbi:hypothetical protein PR048_019578 [Dryococelus australis]|uniref:Uncharacterized protein n=1 Tax=Dryococelus australis TaxID=614101 RepID=A0ABQ9H3U5_9NEOP|nr:hypothetical protein PR048_019578 [Dryococelus australis]